MLYTVCFYHKTTSTYEVSRFFQTIKAAKKWAKMLKYQNYIGEVQIYRGQAGSELVK